MLRSALVALDGSAYSESAVALAIDWARRYGAQLLGLGVLKVALHRFRRVTLRLPTGVASSLVLDR